MKSRDYEALMVEGPVGHDTHYLSHPNIVLTIEKLERGVYARGLGRQE